MRELLGEPRSVGISDRISLELIPALGQQLGPPLGKALRHSTFLRARAHSSNRCFRMLHSSARDSETKCESC
jgi:hypothetical protein